MTRILATLATLSMLLLAAALVLGLTIGDLYERPSPNVEKIHSVHEQLQPSVEASQRTSIHFLTGLAAALMVVFVESVIVTYFIGTSRWCKEVVETYHFDPEITRDSNRLKRSTFPWALAGMLAVVGVISLGAASDPATGRPNTAAWADWHLAGALIGVLLIGWTYAVAWNNVSAQHAIIQGLVARVAKVRHDRGLDERAREGDDIPIARANPPATSANRRDELSL